MKTVAENYAETCAMSVHGRDRSSDGSLNDVMLGKIGENLRDVYGDVAGTELPRSLLALAQALDARLSAAKGDA